MLLKIYICGYLNRIQSSRRLQRKCQRNGELIWLTGRLSAMAPVLGGLLLPFIAHLPHGDWRIGASFCCCATLQPAVRTLAVAHFRAERRANRHHLVPERPASSPRRNQACTGITGYACADCASSSVASISACSICVAEMR